MSHPRWIDSGVFKTLRTATRKRTLGVIVGPAHGDAEISSRAQARAALGDASADSLADDPRGHSQSSEGLAALWKLKQPGFATTSLSDALASSAPEEVGPVRRYGPDSKGLKGAWERKDPFVVWLCGALQDPGSPVLTNKLRKRLVAPDSRYQAFLRTTFSRTVVFTGFALDDPDLIELLDDVSRVFNGHVPENIALVSSGSAEPSTALRASMHYGMNVVEYPSSMTADQALAEVALLLEELEIPKPATGNPPAGFTELTADVRSAVPSADQATLDLFDRGDSSSWASIGAGADAARTTATSLKDFLLAPVEEGKVAVALVRGAEGNGKTTLLRRLAWNLAEDGRRVFWREFGAGVPDRYRPEEADDAVAIFVADDADELSNLPTLLANLATDGQGKARLLLAADQDRWDRSGLDHRIRRDAQVLDVTVDAADADECRAIVEALAKRGRLADGLDTEAAVAAMSGDGLTLMDRIASARGVGSIRDAVSKRLASLEGQADVDLLRRAYLSVATVHRYNMALSRDHLAKLLDIPAETLAERVLAPLDHSLVAAGDSAVRTRHPVVADAVFSLLADSDDARDAVVIDLLRTLPGGSIADNSVFHAPSELIRRVRMRPLAPLTLGKYFEAGENAARNDVFFWYDRGRFDTDFQRWDQALQHLDQALWRRTGDAAQKEHNAQVHGHRARCLMSLKKKKQALAAVEDGLRLSPSDAALERMRDKLGGRRRGPPGRRGDARGTGGRGGERRGGNDRAGSSAGSRSGSGAGSSAGGGGSGGGRPGAAPGGGGRPGGSGGRPGGGRPGGPGSGGDRKQNTVPTSEGQPKGI